ncbi:putative membrane protein, predicted efflux pump [Handroanthus impetiginosus]|uniref:Protein DETOXIFICATION n=1 Tax=Handroanthus impetiginosus TaxID=429701 RepID=A0A2G9FZ49_9LAMI|nr:putative membrane protein, predicted efflux pump [Handroanthus impetiginosus]
MEKALYSLGAFTQTFAGHVGTLELAAFSIENSVIAGLSLGILLGMGSAVETLCGQAYGAGQLEMLGVYLQRSWVILLGTSCLLMFLYIFALPFLQLIGQTESISLAAGKFALWMIPQLFAYALNFPTAKFLQAQSKIMAMALISGAALGLHILFSWLLMLKLGWGMPGGAAVLDTSWWFIVLAQLIYILSGTCGKAWTGFTLRSFQNLSGFVRLSLASAVMMCLETWYFMALILFAGYLKNAEVAVAALSVWAYKKRGEKKTEKKNTKEKKKENPCPNQATPDWNPDPFMSDKLYINLCSTNILGWTNTIAVGFNAAISVRVSNELGAAHPRTAKFSVAVMVLSAFMIGLIISILLLIFQGQYPSLFSDSSEVKDLVYDLTPLLAFCIVVNSIQPALSGVAIGAGWQTLIANVNIVCYYVFGVPLGLILGYTLNMGVRGIWYGMVSGTAVQTFILFWIVYRTDWNKEASIAAQRIRHWRREVESRESDVEKLIN